MRYDQPFYVGINNERFPHRDAYGYLRPIEYSEERAYTQKSEQAEPQWNKRQWDTVQQLKAQVLFLSDKVNKMRANASKRKRTRY